MPILRPYVGHFTQSRGKTPVFRPYFGHPLQPRGETTPCCPSMDYPGLTKGLNRSFCKRDGREYETFSVSLELC